MALQKGRYFPSDKNYILKDVQTELMPGLNRKLVEVVIESYQSYHNPLGLVDDIILKIEDYEYVECDFLIDFYENLSAIYRFHYGENQLEIIFDGFSHYEKYHKDWIETFNSWISDLSLSIHFIKAVLEVTVLFKGEKNAHLAGNRLKNYLHQHFHLKIYRYRGIEKQAS